MKRNRDKIVNANPYELLSYFNEEMLYGSYNCVMELLTDSYIYDENKYRCSTDETKNCFECIEKWLNERDNGGKLM